tara:strand:- start:2800 stop:3021 length:222 start_codon:yes stop_codon:yes gene_type:complete
MGFVACVDDPSQGSSGKVDAPLADVGGQDINDGVDIMGVDSSDADVEDVESPDADVEDVESPDAIIDSEVIEE